jgi:hypothetical protein
MRKIFFLLLLILFTRRAVPQGQGYVQVTGTKACYANGSTQAAFINQSTTPQLPLLNGSVFPTTGVTNMNSAGVFNIFLADNNQVFPTPSQWSLTVCAKSGGQPACGTTQLTVTVQPGGAPQDISSAIASFPCPGGTGGNAAGNPQDVQFKGPDGNFDADTGMFTYDNVNHVLALGPPPMDRNPSDFPTAFGNYAGLPDVTNIQTDCPLITGLKIFGDGRTSDTVAIQQCIWQRMGICPTFFTSCTPVDNRYPHPTNVNSTGVTFLFPQRSYTAAFGLGCSYYTPGGLDIPWGASLEGVGPGRGGTATQLCFGKNDTELSLRGYNTVEHLALFGPNVNGIGGWNRTDPTTFILPQGFGGSSTGYGIQLGSFETINDVFVRYTGSHGVACDSTSSWPGVPTSNLCDANSLTDVRVYNALGSGFYFHGGDGGVNNCFGCHAYNNQLYGFFDDALYSTQFVGALGDANGSDGTTFTGVIPATSSVACTTSACTFTQGSANGLFAGDSLSITGCNDTGLNGVKPVTAVTATTFTVAYTSPFGVSSPTGCAATYRLGTHIWAQAGNTVPGKLAAGGCLYGPQGVWIGQYCEGDQPNGTFVTNGVAAQSSLVVGSQGVTPFFPHGAEIGVIGGSTRIGGAYSSPYNSTSNTRLDDGSGNFVTYYNTQPGQVINQINSSYSKAFFTRTFFGPGANAQGNLANWDCFTNAGVLNGALGNASLCIPDQTILGLTSVTVTNGGTNYSSSTVFKVASTTGAGLGASVSCPITGGVIQNSCTINAPGAGYNPNGLVTAIDPTGAGSGATFTSVVGNVASTDSGRTNLNGHGLAYIPQAFCFGTVSPYIPLSCWVPGTAAPTTGSWRTGDFVYNTAATGPFGWKCTAGGTPGTWTAVGGSGAVTQYAHLGTTGCNLANPSSYDTCTNLITWPVAFADTNYGYTCNGIDAVGSGSVALTTSASATGKTTTQATVVTQTMSTGTGQHFSDIQCIGVHN